MMYRRALLWLVVLSLFFVSSAISSTGVTAQQPCSSSGTQAETIIVFVNHSAADVTAFWLDAACEEKPYHVVQPGASVTQSTFDGHEWVLRDTAGREVGRGVAKASETVTITVGQGSADQKTGTNAFGFDYRPEGRWTLIEGSLGCIIRPVTASMGLDPFYQKYCDYDGMLIISSNQVPDAALATAWNMIANLLQNQPRIFDQLMKLNMRIGIVGAKEGITQLPEYAFLRGDKNTNWDQRSRGFGGTPDVPLSSGAEENLLCYPTDPYLGESIFVHEFAHTMKNSGLDLIDPDFARAVAQAYANAKSKGLWNNTYAQTTVDEYWAEGVQDYFNNNLTASPSDGIHNEINTRAELKDYDPRLFEIINTVFGGYDWTPTCGK